MKQLRQVVMLSTEKASNYQITKILFNKDRLTLSNETLAENINRNGAKLMGYEPQHLYIISDEEIKEGDYVIDDINTKPFLLQINNQGAIDASKKQNYKNWRKVIATTHKSLQIDSGHEAVIMFVPLIPESFIKAFVESNGTIKEVLVEYEGHKCACTEYTPATKNCPKCRGNGELEVKLKLRPDNTIIISRSKIYTREEVKIKCKQTITNCCNEISNERLEHFLNKFDKWIEENL